MCGAVPTVTWIPWQGAQWHGTPVTSVSLGSQAPRCASPLSRAAPAPLCQAPHHSTAGRAGQWLHLAALMDSNLNFRIIQAVIKLGHLPVQGSSIPFDLENFASVSELQFQCRALWLFFLSFPSVLSLKEIRSWKKGLMHWSGVSSHGRLWVFTQVATRRKRCPWQAEKHEIPKPPCAFPYPGKQNWQCTEELGAIAT